MVGGSLLGRDALAASGSEGFEKLGFKETLGTAGAVGTVFGASTLPFYSQPGTHLMNLAYGAAAGLVVGTGFWLFQGGQHSETAQFHSIPIVVTPDRVCLSVVSFTW